MLEELCRSAMYDLCHAVVNEERQLVILKGKQKAPRRFIDFFNSSLDGFHWSALPFMKAMNAKTATTIRRSWFWFNDNSKRICEAYIRDEYGGDIERAMLSAGTFRALFNDFKEYFAKRRALIVKEIEVAVSKKKQELAKRNKLPQSHGGVANLLKVLTKTMHEQGNSIYTVAKVQYAICVQAGIYIPDEFLTDVLTAVDVMEGDANGNG